MAYTDYESAKAACYGELPRFLDDNGVRFNASGFAYCIFHADGKKPNMYLYKKNKYGFPNLYCHSCEKFATIFDAAMALWNCDWNAAFDGVLRYCGVSLANFKTQNPQKMKVWHGGGNSNRAVDLSVYLGGVDAARRERLLAINKIKTLEKIEKIESSRALYESKQAAKAAAKAREIEREREQADFIEACVNAANSGDSRELWAFYNGNNANTQKDYLAYLMGEATKMKGQ